LIGYSLSGEPRGEAARLIVAASACGRPALSLDTPSGVDGGSSTVFVPAVHAVATLTLALPKTGFADDRARSMLGDLYLADISVPPALYGRLGIEVGALFGAGSLLRLEWTGAGWAAAEAVSA
jgi:NAD(P)H-hydrate epimerase